MQIKMKCWDEEIEIEVSRGDHSVCYSIWSEWDNKPYVVIDYWLCPDKRFRNLLALDMVARFHKSSLFEQIYSKDANDDAVAKHQALVSNYIDVIREAIDQDLSYPKSGSPSSIVRQIYNANDDIFRVTVGRIDHFLLHMVKTMLLAILWMPWMMCTVMRVLTRE
jgi:hypothetical protein